LARLPTPTDLRSPRATTHEEQHGGARLSHEALRQQLEQEAGGGAEYVLVLVVRRGRHRHVLAQNLVRVVVRQRSPPRRRQRVPHRFQLGEVFEETVRDRAPSRAAADDAAAAWWCVGRPTLPNKGLAGQPRPPPHLVFGWRRGHDAALHQLVQTCLRHRERRAPRAGAATRARTPAGTTTARGGLLMQIAPAAAGHRSRSSRE